MIVLLALAAAAAHFLPASEGADDSLPQPADDPMMQPNDEPMTREATQPPCRAKVGAHAHLKPTLHGKRQVYWIVHNLIISRLAHIHGYLHQLCQDRFSRTYCAWLQEAIAVQQQTAVAPVAPGFLGELAACSASVAHLRMILQGSRCNNGLIDCSDGHAWRWLFFCTCRLSLGSWPGADAIILRRRPCSPAAADVAAPRFEAETVRSLRSC
jgi:hypothetical protein